MDIPRILVTDPSPERRAELKQLLSIKQVELTETATCEEALPLLTQIRPDILLTETILPGKSGLHLLKEAKKIDPVVEVIFLSHDMSSYSVLQALRNGAYDFIIRPLDSGEILYNSLDRAFATITLRRQNARLIEELEKKTVSLQNSLARMKALNRSIEGIAKVIDVGELLKKLLDVALGQLEARRGFLALIDQGDSMAIKVARGIQSEESRILSGNPSPGLMRALARRGKPVLIPSGLPEKLARWAGEKERKLLESVPGLVAAPLHLKGRVVGLVVLLGHREDQVFDEHDLHFLIQLSHHAALALEKAGIIHKLKRGKG